jgi:enoyl-CoA hydratase
MSTWTCELDGQVGLLTFTRPDDNYMDFASMIELGDQLEALAVRSDEIKVIVLTGGLDDFFIHHADLDDLVRAGEGNASDEEIGSWGRALRLLEEIPQPTVAAIDGLASGGGNEIALTCTLRIASERARLEQPEVTVGIIPGGGGSVRLPRLIGTGMAAEVLMTGRAFSADEARACGWVNAVLPTDDFASSAVSWAQLMARNPATALYAAKRSIVDGSKLPIVDALALEQRLFNDLSASSEALKQAAGGTASTS